MPYLEEEERPDDLADLKEQDSTEAVAEDLEERESADAVADFEEQPEAFSLLGVNTPVRASSIATSSLSSAPSRHAFLETLPVFGSNSPPCA